MSLSRPWWEANIAASQTCPSSSSPSLMNATVRASARVAVRQREADGAGQALSERPARESTTGVRSVEIASNKAPSAP